MKKLIKSIISLELRRALRFDILRLRVRLRNLMRHRLTASSEYLHLGCGSRRVAGWLNVDIAGSDLDIDLTCPMPWSNEQFNAVVSQHVIEHLELERELLPLFREIYRVCRPGAEVWFSTPDMAVVCRSYITNKGADLLADRVMRRPDSYKVMTAIPTSHIINHMFHQMGQHKNLLDFELLKWALETSGFVGCERVNEELLLKRFRGFPPRHDDWQSIYVRAEVPTID